MPLPGLHGISEQDWPLAVAREAVIRPLSLRSRIRAADIEAAAATLSVSVSRSMFCFARIELIPRRARSCSTSADESLAQSA
jgi:hypothetical protein